MLLRYSSALLILIGIVYSVNIKLVFINKNAFPVWIGTREVSLLVGQGGGFKINPKQKRAISLDIEWSGKFIAVPICKGEDTICNEGTCSNRQQCTDAIHQKPKTAVQIASGVGDRETNYAIDLGDGFNLKASILPFGGVTDCERIECDFNLTSCLSSLRVTNEEGETTACHSSCSKFGTEEYCCSGTFNAPDKCIPGKWMVNSARMFNRQCADAFAYPYDDSLKVYSCANASGYTITYGG